MSQTTGKSSQAPFTIMVTDDDHAVRRSIQLMLCSRGYNVLSYTTGKALLADPKSKCADCLVVDYCMPDVNGLVVLETLRARGWQGKAIMISAYCGPLLEIRARQAGFDGLIAKPNVARAIIDAVERFSKQAN